MVNKSALIYFSTTLHLEYTRSTVDHWDTSEHDPVLLGFQSFASIWSVGYFSCIELGISYKNTQVMAALFISKEDQ